MCDGRHLANPDADLLFAPAAAACFPKRLQSPDAVATRQLSFCSFLRNSTFPFSPLLAGSRFYVAGLGYIRETLNLRTRRAAERKCLRLFDCRIRNRPLRRYLPSMPSKPLDLPMDVAKNFVRDMRAYFAEPNLRSLRR